MVEIKKSYIDTNSGQMHYRYTEGKGLPLVLFHRTPSSSVMYERMMYELNGLRPIYALDTPGFGNSFNPEGMPSISNYRDWLCEAINALSIDNFHIYAHHTGTHFAAEIALLWPERVQSLALNGAAYFSYEERELFFKNFTQVPNPDHSGKYLHERFTLIKSFFPVFDPELVNLELIGALRSIEGRNQAFASLKKQDFAQILREVKCPILVMSAINDFFIDKLKIIKKDIPSARIAELGKTLIASPELDTKKTIDLLIDFIEQRELRTKA